MVLAFAIFVLLNTFVLSEIYQVANNSSKNKTLIEPSDSEKSAVVR